MKWLVRSPQKLAPFLGAQLQSSGKQMRKALEANLCRVNGRIERFGSASLRPGDTVEMAADWKRSQATEKPTLLYEDEYLQIVNKPVGVVCSQEHFKALLVHRLDKDTTGVLLLAKNGAAKDKLMELFEQREMVKKYIALVDGIPRAESGVQESRLMKKGSFQGQTIWGSGPQGQTAITHWTKLASGKQAALILCEPYTGRTHQIRVHMAEMGHPILVDRQYASSFRCPLFIQRPLLHAAALEFIHPFTGQKIVAQAPLPLDICEALRNVSIRHVGDFFGKQQKEDSRDQSQNNEKSKEVAQSSHFVHQSG